MNDLNFPWFDRLKASKLLSGGIDGKGRLMAVPDNWLYHYQTLVTGAAALVAAGAAVWVSGRQAKIAKDQLNAGKQLAASDRAAKLRAARASLPATLDAVCDFAEAAITSIHNAWPGAADLYPEEQKGQRYRLSFGISAFPPQAIQPLERVIELVDDHAVTERIEEMLAEVQVFQARMKPYKQGGSVTLPRLASYIIQAAGIHARANSLFKFARREAPSVDAACLWNFVEATLNEMRLTSRTEIAEQLQAQKEAGLSPGDYAAV